MDLTFYQIMCIRDSIKFFAEKPVGGSYTRDELLDYIERVISSPYDPENVKTACSPEMQLLGPLGGHLHMREDIPLCYQTCKGDS